MQGRAQRLREQLLHMRSGAPDGVPAWVVALADGSDEGYFGPESAVWPVHGGIPVLIAGMRALLLQTLHPGAMAGVHDWSRYREDPLGRLFGTVRWALTTSFGELREQLAAFGPDLQAGDRVRDAVRFVRMPPLGISGPGGARSGRSDDRRLCRRVRRLLGYPSSSEISASRRIANLRASLDPRSARA